MNIMKPTGQFHHEIYLTDHHCLIIDESGIRMADIDESWEIFNVIGEVTFNELYDILKEKRYNAGLQS